MGARPSIAISASSAHGTGDMLSRRQNATHWRTTGMSTPAGCGRPRPRPARARRRAACGRPAPSCRRPSRPSSATGTSSWTSLRRSSVQRERGHDEGDATHVGREVESAPRAELVPWARATLPSRQSTKKRSRNSTPPSGTGRRRSRRRNRSRAGWRRRHPVGRHVPRLRQPGGERGGERVDREAGPDLPRPPGGTVIGWLIVLRRPTGRPPSREQDEHQHGAGRQAEARTRGDRDLHLPAYAEPGPASGSPHPPSSASAGSRSRPPRAAGRWQPAGVCSPPGPPSSASCSRSSQQRLVATVREVGPTGHQVGLAPAPVGLVLGRGAVVGPGPRGSARWVLGTAVTRIRFRRSSSAAGSVLPTTRLSDWRETSRAASVSMVTSLSEAETPVRLAGGEVDRWRGQQDRRPGRVLDRLARRDHGSEHRAHEGRDEQQRPGSPQPGKRGLQELCRTGPGRRPLLPGEQTERHHHGQERHPQGVVDEKQQARRRTG